MNKRPDWCPHQECIYKLQSQDKICVGKLPKPADHGEFKEINTHRLCLDTRKTWDGIFDLQLNWGDCWNMIRLLKTVKD